MFRSTSAENANTTPPHPFAEQSDVDMRRMLMSPFKDELIQAYDNGYAQGYDDARAEFEGELKCCRNELCLRCGSYKQAHLGACDGCRWKH